MIKQFVAREFCLACHGCCRFAQPDTIWSPCLLQEDVRQLVKHKIPFLPATAGHKIKVVYDKDRDTFICGFLNPGSNRCGIYAFRPFECRLYPFLLNRRGEKIFLAVDAQCPGVGKNVKSAHFKKYTRYLADLLRSPALSNALRRNPQVIQAYAEAIDLVELKP